MTTFKEYLQEKKLNWNYVKDSGSGYGYWESDGSDHKKGEEWQIFDPILKGDEDSMGDADVTDEDFPKGMSVMFQYSRTDGTDITIDYAKNLNDYKNKVNKLKNSLK